MADLLKECFLWLAFEAEAEGANASSIRRKFGDSGVGLDVLGEMIDDILDLFSLGCATDVAMAADESALWKPTDVWGSRQDRGGVCGKVPCPVASRTVVFPG